VKTRVVAISLLALLSGAPASRADEPTTAPTTAPTTSPSADISALVSQLTGDSVSDRDAAQLALLDVGEEALPALDAARKDVRDADVQVRLDTLLVQIRERADVGASKVTLKFDDAPLDEVLKSLGKQTRTDFGGDLVNEIGGGRPDGVPRVTLDLKDVTFWRAMQELQDTANIVFYPQPDGWRVTRNFGQPNSIRGSESGAFLIQPTMASYSRNISYSRNMGGDGENFMIQFQAQGEPKIKLANGVGTMTLESAVDSNGNDLIGAQRVQQIQTGNGQSVFGCGLPLKYPKNPGSTITEIRGTLRVSIARRSQQISSDDLAGGGVITASIDGTKIRIEPSTGDTPRGGVSFTITVDSGGDAAIAQRLQQSAQQMIRVTDARDVGMQVVNSSIVRSDNRGLAMRLTYASRQPQVSKGPFKLRIEVPTSFREVDVPFVMKDLRMP
jgi:hypothetical protein